MERARCPVELEIVHDARPDLFTVWAIGYAFGDMNFAYCTQIKGGTREIMLLGPDGIKWPACAMLALQASSAMGPRWVYPTAFLIRGPCGLWMARAAPRMGEKGPTASWKALTDQEKRKSARVSAADDEGESALVETTHKEADKKKIYPPGRPFRLDGQDISKKFRP